jgi:hypothetical protein
MMNHPVVAIISLVAKRATESGDEGSPSQALAPLPILLGLIVFIPLFIYVGSPVSICP